MSRHTLLSATLIAFAIPVAAQQPIAKPDMPRHIVEEVEADGIITVEMPRGVYERLQPVEPQIEEVESQPASTTQRSAAGFRVQAFSGNSASAKHEGQSREAQVRAYFPQYDCYLVYNAPYWRLRVGDFRTRAEAEDFAATMKKAFPALKREITVVRDRINLNQ